MRELVLTFRGVEYRVPASKAFALADAIEDIATLAEIVAMMANPKFIKFAKMQGIALRMAGAQVSDEEVFATMMDEVRSAQPGGDPPSFSVAIAAIMAVLMDGAPNMTGAGDDAPKAPAS